MDIAAAKTFLEIVRTGSFVSAAANLHVTQTAVSARVRVLEDELGKQLFLRAKAGVTLTPAGAQFQRFAVSFVQMWEHARRAVALPPGTVAVVSIGAELIVSNPIMPNWLRWMRAEHPEVAVIAHLDHADRLVEKVRAGTLELAVLYGAPAYPGLVNELLIEDRLVMAETVHDKRQHGPEDYVAIEWGGDFATGYQAAFPDRPDPLVRTNFGPLALDHLMAVGGTAYLRMTVARPLLEAGKIRLIPDTPEFHYSIFAVHATKGNEDLLRLVRNGLREAVADL